MTKSKVPVWAIVLLVVSILTAIIALSFIGPYNKMVSLQQTVETRQADIQTQLQAKMDKISQMLPQVEALVSKDSSLAEEISKLSDQLAKSDTLSAHATLGQLEAADNSSTAIVSTLQNAMQKDTSLSSSVLSDYMIAVEGMENRLSVARLKYNEAVSEYNTCIRKFPNSIAAGLLGFEPADFFQAES